MTLTEMSFVGAVMILVIAAIRAIAINKLPKKTFILLWEISMLRLTLPFSVPSATSIYTLFERNTENVQMQPVPNIAFTGNTVLSEVTAEQISENISSAGTSFSVWQLIWFAGAIIMLIGFIAAYAISFKKLKSDTELDSGFAAEWVKGRNLKRKVRIYLSDKISSPLTYGIIRPVILIPVSCDIEDKATLTYILTHETEHIKRFDMLRKIIAAAVLCIHWFNPAVWVLFLLYNRDIELACDEAVVKNVGGDCRSDYAMALIGMEETQSGVFSLLSHFSKNAVEERIVAIMKFKRITAVAAAAACAAVFSVTSVFATSAPAKQNDNDSSPVSEAVTISNGKTRDTFYSFDGGKTFVSEEEANISVPDVEWWTYDEYKTWLENEKIELQKCLGEKGWTRGTGWFVWTQEKIDETIAMYEKTLEQIKNGVKISKSVDGDESIMLMQSTSVGQTSEMSADQLDTLAENSKEDILKKFGKYGISFDKNDKLLYNGEAVRFFCDGCEVENGWAINSSFYDEKGKIDVYTVYEATPNGDGSYDPMGKLKGLRKASEKEFDNISFSFTTSNGDAITLAYDNGTTASDFSTEFLTQVGDTFAEGNSDTVSGTSFETIFSRYKKYGITYKAIPGSLGNVYYNDELVKHFSDDSPNGSAFCFESTDGGKITVAAQYDKNGKLCGVKKVS